MHFLFVFDQVVGEEVVGVGPFEAYLEVVVLGVVVEGVGAVDVEGFSVED